MWKDKGEKLQVLPAKSRKVAKLESSTSMSYIDLPTPEKHTGQVST